MGNSDIRSLAHIEQIDYDELNGKTIAIDGHNWLYRYVKITSRYNEVKDYKKGDYKVPNLIGTLMGVSKITQNKVKPLIIFDGGFDDLKKEELEDRKEKREKAKKKQKEHRDNNKKAEAAKYRSRSQTLTDKMIETTQELLDMLDIKHIKAPKSAESQAAYLCKSNNQINYSLSTDYDILLYGSPRTVRNFTSSSRETELMSLNKALNKNNINREQLIEIALLCGTDYFEGVKGIGPKTGLDIVKNGNINDHIDNKERFKKAKNIFQNPDVKDYSKNIRQPSPNIEEVKKYVIDKWEIPERTVEKQIEKIRENTKKKTLDDF
jgi:flap endonuclease-1